MKRSKKGILIVLSGPSGVGKSTVVKELLKISPKLLLSISATTRPPRHFEKQNIDYIFMSKEDFSSLLKKNQFLEWAKVHGHDYGTPRDFVEEELKKHHAVLLEVDTQGAAQIREEVRLNLYKLAIPVFIFLIPPSVDILAVRLQKRKTESEETMNRRLRTAISELQVMEKYDYIVVNDDVPSAAKKIHAIINVEKERTLLN
jgi:guanylate kinase